MRQLTNCPGNVSFLLLAVSNNIYAITTFFKPQYYFQAVLQAVILATIDMVI